MKPILFTAENRQRTRSGNKTQTRRVITDSLSTTRARFDGSSKWEEINEQGEPTKKYFEWSTRYRVGGICYMCEPYQIETTSYNKSRQVIGRYLDDGKPFDTILTYDEWDRFVARKYPYNATQARFMYKSLARTFIQITDLRLQPLQEISEKDAIAEGIKEYIETLSPFLRARGALSTSYYAGHFQRLWDSIHNHYTWESNPTVLAITYQLTDPPIPNHQSPITARSAHNKRLSDQ